MYEETYRAGQIYTNKRERHWCRQRLPSSESHGTATNRTRIELLDRRRSESRVGGLRHSYDNAPTIAKSGQGSGCDAAQHQEVKTREVKSLQE